MPRRKLSLVPALAIAVDHPLRVRILSILLEEEASAATLANQITGSTVPKISYHLRVLAEDCRLIEPARPKAQDIGADTSYRLKPRSQLQAGHFSGNSESVRVELLRALAAETARAIDTGLLDVGDPGTFRAQTLTVDEQGLTEINDVLDDAMERAKRAETKSRRRLKSEKGESVYALVGAAVCRVETLPAPQQEAGCL